MMATIDDALAQARRGLRGAQNWTTPGGGMAGSMPQLPPPGVAADTYTTQNPNFRTGQSPEARAFRGGQMAEVGPPASGASPSGAQPSGPRPSVSPRAGRAVGQGLRGLLSVPAALAGAGMATAADADTTERYYRGLAMDPNDRSLGRDLVARGAGVMQDLGNTILDVGTGVVNTIRGAAGAQPIPTFTEMTEERRGGPRVDRPQSVAPPSRQNDSAPVQAAAPAGPVAPAPAGLPGEDLSNGIRQVGGVITNVPNPVGVNPMRIGEAFEPLTEAQGRARSQQRIGEMNRTIATMRENTQLANELRGMIGTGQEGTGLTKVGLAADRDPGQNTAAGDYVASLQRKVDNNTATSDERNALSGLMRAQVEGGLRAQEGALNRAAQSEDRRFIAELSSADRAAQRDISLRGQDLIDRRAAASAQADAFEKDRRYQLDVARLGEDQAKRIRENRDKAETSARELITSLIPAGADGKPDTVTSAEYTRRLVGQLGNMQMQAEATLAKDPNNAAAKRVLKSVQDGTALQDRAFVEQFVAGMEADKAAARGSGWMPWSGSRVISNAPITGLRLDDSGLFDFYVSDRGDRIPAREIDSDGSLFFGPRNQRFDGLKQR